MGGQPLKHLTDEQRAKLDRRRSHRGPSADQIEKLAKLVSQGVPEIHACRGVGVAHSTFTNWKTYGRDAINADGNPTDLEMRCINMVDALDRAHAFAVSKRVVEIDVAGENGDWRASAYWLERRTPEFAPPKRMEVSGPRGGPIELSSLIVDAQAILNSESQSILSEAEEITTGEITSESESSESESESQESE